VGQSEFFGMRDMPMTTYNNTIRVGIVDALLNVIGDES
jgi:hypothetical protein